MKKEKNDTPDNSSEIKDECELEKNNTSENLNEDNNQDSNDQILLQAEVDKLNDALLRSRAELDNFQKRTLKQIQQAQLYSIEKLSSELLVIMDSLEAAEKLSNDPNLKIENLVEGNNLLLKTTKEVFDKLSIEEIDPLGNIFDPELHQAMATKDSKDDENTVVEVMQKGYKLQSKLLRPALVIVSKKVKKNLELLDFVHIYQVLAI